MRRWPTATPALGGALAMVAWLATINLLVLVFNLLPAFPMDGGRVVRAIAWWRTGDRSAATRFAANLGRVFAYLFIGGGLLLIFTGGVFAGVWLALIGMVVNGSARAPAIQTKITGGSSEAGRRRRNGSRAGCNPRQAKRREGPRRVLPSLRWPWFPVVDAAHRFLGLIARDKADEVPETSRTTSFVSDVLERDDGTFQVRDDAPFGDVAWANTELCVASAP